MKKKSSASIQDKKDWIEFTENVGNIPNKEEYFSSINKQRNIPKLDLHGCSLTEANVLVKNFIIKSFNNGDRKILIITGKGKRSKTLNNPYISEKFSILKNSVPQYIKNEIDLSSKVTKISTAPIKDGGEGAISIKLKKN